MFFLSDSTGGVAVSLADERLVLPSPGASVTVTGTTAPDTFFPMVRANAITPEGKAGLPPAREITFEQGLTGAEHAQWVEIRGQLRQFAVLDGWLQLTLGTPAGEFSASIPARERLSAAVGDSLRVQGVCSVWTVTNTHKIGGFFLFTPSLANVQVLEPDTAKETTLTQVNQVQRLRAAEAKSGRPVQLRGVITFAHPDQRVFYLNDATGGVPVWLEDTRIALPAAGVSASVRGRTSSGVFSAIVHADEIETEGLQALPVPHAISLEQALTGSEDSQWVEMRGHLRQVEVGGDWLRLTLAAAAGEFTISIPHATAIDAKVGSFLHVQGVCQTWLKENSQIGGVFLYTPSLSQIRVVEPPAADPFAAPEEAISNLLLYRTQTLQQQQMLIRGIVLQHVPGRYVVVQNASGVVRALSRSEAPLRPGDRVDVVGVPGRQGNRPVLRGAVFRRTGSGPAPAPWDPPGGLKLDPALEGRLVTVTGTVVNSSWRPEDTRLIVRAGNAVLEIVYSGALPARFAANWQTGSRIVVVGLYSLEYDEEDQPVKFSLQLRSSADVVVQERPSWWTAGRALSGLGVIGGCLVLGLIWVVALRRQVRHQTGVIRTQLEKEANLRARHGELIENASDFIFTTDLQGNFTSFNPAGERITGYSRAEALKLGLRDLVAPHDAATVTALLSLALLPEPAPAARFETRLQTRDGRSVWLETSARLIHEAGGAAGLLGIARDVTERKQAEAEKEKLEELNRQLEKSESLGRMAGAIAHHFNNQLHVVILSLEMAMQDLPKNAGPVESLSLAMQSARKAAEVSTLMLTYLGQSPGDREPLDLSETCRQGVARLETVRPKNVHLATSLPSPGPVVRANANQIQQVLTSLVTNAWEAGDDTGAVIRLTVTTVFAADISAAHRFPVDCRLHDAAYACLEVADASCGISKQDIEKIFDPFFTSKHPGRGMGLAVVLGIVRISDGAITVESEPGRGSVFRVFLPVCA